MDSRISITYDEYIEFIDCKSKLMLITDYLKRSYDSKTHHEPIEEILMDVCGLNAEK